MISLWNVRCVSRKRLPLNVQNKRQPFHYTLSFCIQIQKILNIYMKRNSDDCAEENTENVPHWQNGIIVSNRVSRGEGGGNFSIHAWFMWFVNWWIMWMIDRFAAYETTKDSARLEERSGWNLQRIWRTGRHARTGCGTAWYVCVCVCVCVQDVCMYVFFIFYYQSACSITW